MYIETDISQYVDDYNLPDNHQSVDQPNCFDLTERYETIEEEDDE